MTKEALKLALEALEVANSCVDGYYIPKGKTHLPEIKLAITAIKEALAQPELEPVAWMNQLDNNFFSKQRDTFTYSIPLYTTPPQRKPLTDEEILTYRHMLDWTAEWSYINFARAIEAAHGIKGEA